jgi:predicted Zn-dependent peptidase
MTDNGKKTTIALTVLLAVFLTGMQARQIWKTQPRKVELEAKKDDRWEFLFHQDTTAAITSVQVLVKGGKRAEPAHQRGLAFLAAGLAVEMPTDSRIRRLMHMGSTVFYDVQGDYSVISIKSLTEHLDETLKIVGGVIEKPLFSSLRIGNNKRYMENRRKGEDDSPEQLMERIFLDAFFNSEGKKTPGGAAYDYSGSIYGDEKSRKKIKRKDIQQFYKRFFNRANIIIAVSSDLSQTGIGEIMGRHFNSLPAGQPVTVGSPGFPPIQGKIPEKKEFYLEKENQQVLIAFGALLPPMSRENYARLYMLDNLLGKGQGSKLWPLRAQKDLAYTINTHFTQYRDGGIFAIYLKTDIHKKDRAYKALKELLAGIYRQGASGGELESAAVRSRADFLRQNETRGMRTLNMAYFEALGAGVDFLETFFSDIDRVALEDFNRYLKEVLNPAGLVEAIIGPAPGPG